MWGREYLRGSVPSSYDHKRRSKRGLGPQRSDGLSGALCLAGEGVLRLAAPLGAARAADQHICQFFVLLTASLGGGGYPDCLLGTSIELPLAEIQHSRLARPPPSLALVTTIVWPPHILNSCHWWSAPGEVRRVGDVIQGYRENVYRIYASVSLRDRMAGAPLDRSPVMS